jgi:hypothetical protein
MNKLLMAGACVAALSVAGAASANSFVNGGFESGDFTGWEQGGGFWFGGAYPVPNDPAYYPGTPVNAITSAGFDPLTNNNLATVYNGAHSARVNNSNNDYSVSVIRQTVTNYGDTQIAFAYAAVLQSSHGPSDSDAFIIQLNDLTTNTTLFTKNVNSATVGSDFHAGAGNWFYTDWTPEVISVTAGHDYQLALLANDCPYGGHAGYAYLDGFGAVVPPKGGGVPEPATWAMLIAGFGLAGSALRGQRKTAALA